MQLTARIIVCGTGIWLGLLGIVAPARAATKVFLLGGQSNMAGVGGYDSPLPESYNTPPANVKFWDYGTPQPVNGLYGIFVHPWVGDHWVDLTGGFGHQTNYFGPEVSFGRRLQELFPDDQIYLVKEGISNSTLAVDWNPDGSGTIYNRFKERVEAAIDNLQGMGLDPQIAGMIWMQGESDAMNVAYAAQYQSNLMNLISHVRSDFGMPDDAPFVIGRILSCWDTSPAGGNTTVRTAQETIGNQPGYESATWIDTDELQLAYGGHYGTQGQLDLGIRFADKFAPAPEPSAMALLISGVLGAIAYAWRRRKSM